MSINFTRLFYLIILGALLGISAYWSIQYYQALPPRPTTVAQHLAGKFKQQIDMLGAVPGKVVDFLSRQTIKPAGLKTDIQNQLEAYYATEEKYPAVLTEIYRNRWIPQSYRVTYERLTDASYHLEIVDTKSGSMIDVDKQAQ